jgi:ribosomal protein L12E/L44/L45/RPP1/RPP2
MSTPTTDPFDPELDDPEGDGDPADQPKPRDPVRAELRRAQKRIKELEGDTVRAATAERQLTMIKAGVKVDDPKAKYFVSGYAGEMTADAVKAAAVEAGLVEAAPAAPPEGQQAAQRLDALNASTTSVPRPGDKNAEYQNRMRGAQNEAEALAIMREYDIPVVSNNS